MSHFIRVILSVAKIDFIMLNFYKVIFGVTSDFAINLWIKSYSENFISLFSFSSSHKHCMYDICPVKWVMDFNILSTVLIILHLLQSIDVSVLYNNNQDSSSISFLIINHLKCVLFV